MDFLLVLFTLGYILQLAAQAFILMHIKNTKSIDGLQMDSQIILLIAQCVRIFWFLDTSLYEIPLVYLEIALSLGLQGYILFLFRQYKDSQYVAVKSLFNVYTLVPFCMVLALLINPGQSFMTYEILISLSFFLESVAVLPQIHYMRKMGTVDVKIGKYLVCLAASRLVRILFWIQYWLSGEVFKSLLFADVLHTLLLGDFVWLYFKSQGRGNMIIV